MKVRFLLLSAVPILIWSSSAAAQMKTANPSPEPPAPAPVPKPKICKLVVVFDQTTPPWLFWRYPKGEMPCPGGVSACLTADGKPPPTDGITEDDTFEGVCWDKLPANAPAPANTVLMERFVNYVVVPLLSSPSFLPE